MTTNVMVITVVIAAINPIIILHIILLHGPGNQCAQMYFIRSVTGWNINIGTASPIITIIRSVVSIMLVSCSHKIQEPLQVPNR